MNNVSQTGHSQDLGGVFAKGSCKGQCRGLARGLGKGRALGSDFMGHGEQVRKNPRGLAKWAF